MATPTPTNSSRKEAEPKTLNKSRRINLEPPESDAGDGYPHGPRRRFNATVGGRRQRVGKVQARVGGHDWYEGRITTDNGDGTYAIRYDDGDYEPRVQRGSST